MKTFASTHPGIDRLPPDARVWVYKSARMLTEEEIQRITERGAAFVANWAAHGAPLTAAVEVLHDRFVVIGVDEVQARASGCSIDKSVQFIQSLERDLGVQLTDRTVIWYEKDGVIDRCRVASIESMILNGELTAGSILYDDLVATKADLETRFRVPLRESWLARYL